jgi:hypothetical protein
MRQFSAIPFESTEQPWLDARRAIRLSAPGKTGALL